MAHQQPIRSKNVTGTREIPDKLYFRIGEVARLCGVPAYVLRFWETEFPQLRPNKGGTGQRLYRRRDVEMALRVKTLLYEEGYTIAGARQIFKSEPKKDAPQLALAIDTGALRAGLQKLRKLRGEMQELLTLLSEPLAERASETPVQTPVQSIRSARTRRPFNESESGTLFAATPPEAPFDLPPDPDA